MKFLAALRLNKLGSAPSTPASSDEIALYFNSSGTLTKKDSTGAVTTIEQTSSTWTAYTPTLSNVTLGNGTLSCAYVQFGKTVHFRIKLTLGSTSAITGAPTFTLPVTAVAARAFSFAASAYDSSAGNPHFGLDAMNTTTTVFFRQGNTSLSSTVPFTWATGDELYVSGTYEAA